MVDRFWDFWSLSNPNVLWVLTGSVLLASCAAVIGCFALLRRQALTGDALAHAALPGVTTAFLATQSRSPLVLLVGAIVSCFIGYFVIEYLVRRTRVKQDSALAIVLSLFFAAGVFQLTHIQKLGSGSQAGLDKLLFGQAASLVPGDVRILGILAGGVFVYVVLVFEKLKLITFDRNYALALGVRVRGYEASLAFAMVLSVAIGLQLVGVVLMAAMLLTPGAAARYWSDRLSVVVALAGVFGVVAGVAGANISYMAPKMPTGPWMVVVLTALFGVSLLAAPRRGLLSRWNHARRTARRVQEENILRTLFKIHEEDTEGQTERFPPAAVPSSKILAYRNIELSTLESLLAGLERSHDLIREDGSVRLTEQGLLRAEEITRFHRLWEAYLSEHINLPSDHVHEDAEKIEHVLTDELAGRIQSELRDALADPHGKAIPEPREGEKK